MITTRSSKTAPGSPTHRLRSNPGRALGAVALTALLGLAGCGGSSAGAPDTSGSTATDDAPGDGTPGTAAPGGTGGSSACGDIYTSSLCATVKVNGSVTIDDQAVSAIDGGDCATWAEGDGDELRLPLFIDGLSDGTPFTMERLVTDYTGPGTYELDQLSGEGSNFTLVVGDDRYVASPDGDATATLTIEASGAGSVAISDFEISDGSGGYSSAVDADIYWDCVDPS